MLPTSAGSPLQLGLEYDNGPYLILDAGAGPFALHQPLSDSVGERWLAVAEPASPVEDGLGTDDFAVALITPDRLLEAPVPFPGHEATRTGAEARGL